MWTRILFGSVLTAQLVAWLASDSAIFADEKPSESQPLLFAADKSIRLEIIQGRLRVIGLRGPQNRNVQRGDENADAKETLSIHAGVEDLVVRYELNTLQRRMLLSQDMRQRFVLENEVIQGATSARLMLKQWPDGRCEFSTSVSEHKLTCRGGIWHFSVLYPEVFYGQVLPLLEELHPNWQLQVQAMRVRENLARPFTGELRAKQEDWQNWVSDLTSDDFTVRQAADRGLRGSGPEVLGFLEHAMQRKLEKEQKARIQHIAKQLAPPSADHPELASRWLEQDPQIWLSLLSQGTPEEQRIAQVRLEAMLGEKLRFDATASATERQAALRKIENRLQVQ